MDERARPIYSSPAPTHYNKICQHSGFNQELTSKHIPATSQLTFLGFITNYIAW